MKKIYSLLAIAGLILSYGCNNMTEIDSPSGEIRMILKTDSAELVTRATEKGDDKLNENKIQTIHYYFFDESSGTLVREGTQTINKTGEARISLSGINTTIFNNIFSGRTELKVLVVVNAAISDGTPTSTMDDIKAKAVALSGLGKQDSFVMTGEGTLTKTGVATAETSEIRLIRLASKITLHLIFPDSYTDGAAKEWIPQLNAVQIDFRHLGKNILAGGEEAPAPVLGNATRKSTSGDFNIEDFYDETVTPKVCSGHDLTMKVPVYSYPRKWSNGDEDTPYIYVSLPWKMKTEATMADTYYKILLPGISLDSNCWYDITARIGGLGSLVKEGTTTIDDLNINVSNIWKDATPGSDNDTDADLILPRVLAVEKNEYVIYNQDEIEIPFLSSHDCEAVSLTIDQTSHPSEMGPQQTAAVVVDNAHRTIRFTHPLLNDQSSKPYDYLIFKAHFTLEHADNPDYHEVIHIEQRPALYIEAFNNAEAYRNVFVDGYQKTVIGRDLVTYSGYYYQLGGSASNTNVYTVTATVLTGGFSSNKIGDPRIHQPVDFSVSPWKDLENRPQGNSNSITGDPDKQLEYYYSAGAETREFIAPSFRIGSAYAGTGLTSFSDPYVTFQMRCATYQEAGYPAGRWRLPTEAELKYCLQLQADGCLGGGIFYEDTYYICATKNVGYAVVTDGEVPTIEMDPEPSNCRCVYDAWYWDNTSTPRLDETEYAYSMCGETDAKYKFCWGDRQIMW